MIQALFADSVAASDSFRLLNSEIGNDLQLCQKRIVRRLSFRLLNSEIGNDRKRNKRMNRIFELFSSP